MAETNKLVDLEGLKQAISKTRENIEKEMAEAVFKAEKTSLDASDSSVIESYFTENDDKTPKNGDIFIVETKLDETEYEYSAYMYDGESWAALTGNVDADKVIMRDNITMAGNYTQVGNKTKTQTGTAVFEVKGKSVAEILTDIFSQRLQPAVTAQPAVASFTLTGAKAVEAGTKLTKADYSAATLNKGSYTFGPADTGVTATNWKVERVTNSGTSTVTESATASLAAGSDTNDGNGFVIGDEGGENTFSSLKYKVTATHCAGVTALDNLGDNSSPEIKIAAGTKTKETSAYTPFRNYFYGATEDKPTLDSAYVRGLTASGKAYAAGNVTVRVAAGSTRVAIACDATKKGVTKIINTSAMNADVTSTFTKQTVSVEGANGYTAKNYSVWVFEPAKPYENEAVLTVTLG